VRRSEWAGYVNFRGFWPKFDLEMKVKVQYWTWIFLHVLLWSLMRNMRFIDTIFLSYRHFKSKINKSASVWLYNLGRRSNMKTFLNSLHMISYTLSILFFALQPIIKKLLSIEIVIFHICTLGNIIRKISVTGSCLEQTWGRTP
jgi:hypothetical protein